MKVVVVCSTLDLRYRLGCTPSWWQLFKAIHELGHEVITLPFLGDPVESLWWRSVENPCAFESKTYNWFLDLRRKPGTFLPATATNSLVGGFVTNRIRKKWSSCLVSVLEGEKNVDAVIFISVPLHFIDGISRKIRKLFGIPVIFYEGDMPISLPRYVKGSGYRFSYYENSDLSEFDAFFTNSRGVIPDLEERGARNVQPFYYAIDPELFRPVDVRKDIDISFFGYGTGLREAWIQTMIVNASLKMPDTRFVLAGKDLGSDLGRADYAGDLPFSAYRDFCCRSRICLNITRSSHASVYASSSARPFELAAFGACIVSNPCEGLSEWFDIGKEIIVLEEREDAAALYGTLLGSEEQRLKTGDAARKRVLKDHTYKARAGQMISAIRRLRT